VHKSLSFCRNPLVLLWSPNPQPNPRIFAAVSDSFGSSVRKSVFTYQVAVFKRRCVTQRRLPSSYRHMLSLGRVRVGSGTMIIAVVGSGRRHTVDQLSARDLSNVHAMPAKVGDKRGVA